MNEHIAENMTSPLLKQLKKCGCVKFVGICLHEASVNAIEYLLKELCETHKSILELREAARDADDMISGWIARTKGTSEVLNQLKIVLAKTAKYESTTMWSKK